MRERGLAWVGISLALAAFWSLVVIGVVTLLGIAR